MNSAEYFIHHKVTSWMLAVLLLLGGGLAFLGLGQLEDPAFTLKKAMVITQYPGASAQQVEEELTYPLENAIQQLPYVDNLSSISSPGLSQITVEMKSIYDGEELPQIWDELRRKVGDYRPFLPPGVQAPFVFDDFGSVYGILLAVTGDGYSYEEINDYADYLRRELVLVPGVGKVAVAGRQQEQVILEISREKLTNLGVDPNRIYQLLGTQNVVSNAGSVRVGSESIRISPTGEFEQIAELENLIISSPGAEQLIHLRDVAKVSRGYREIPDNLVTYGGQQALHLGISFSSAVNVVDVGVAIEQRLQDLEYARPIGMQVAVLYNQPHEVERSVESFLGNLLAAVGIVILVLLLFMGLRSGILIGLILLLTIFGTFIFMKIFAIELQRISLGALIIALGMLVDNAIVVTEGVLIGLQRRLSKLEAARQVVQQTQWPLLGATVIAVAAFAPIGLSPDATGEFAGSLFYVLLISLLLSWLTAITLTPFFCDLFFKESPGQNSSGIDAPAADPYRGLGYGVYRWLLERCLRARWLTLLVMAAALAAAGYGFTSVKQAFFPPSTTPMFLVDYWRVQGTDIRDTYADVQALEAWLGEDARVEYVASTVGKGALRFMLTYGPEKSYPAYAQLLVRTRAFEDIEPLLHKLQRHLRDSYPQAQFKLKRLEIGPSTDAKIEARFSGSEPDQLRQLASQAQAILEADGGAINIRHDWRERTKVIRPQFSEANARRAGISKQDLDDILLMNFSGKPIGLYRDGTTLLPILARTPDVERLTVDSLPELKVWSPLLRGYVPIEQVVSSFDLEWEDSLINRRDRKRTLTVKADPDLFGGETANALFKRLRPQLEAIPLPPGYSLEWGGEYESSRDAQASLFASLPLGFLVMFVITVLLFNSLRQSLVIWLTVPLALIGVTLGLLLLDKPFGFMALLGFLSLSGMVLKNGIVLLDQINLELAEGKAPFAAVVDSAISRVRPVCMAAITTVLGMIPLLFDDFFASMAVVIIFGLGFATILTLLVVPVLYLVFFRIPYPDAIYTSIYTSASAAAEPPTDRHVELIAQTCRGER